MAPFVSVPLCVFEEISVMAIAYFLVFSSRPPCFCTISDTKFLWAFSHTSQYFLTVPLPLLSHPEIVFLNNFVMFPLLCLSGTAPATKTLPSHMVLAPSSISNPLMLTVASSSQLCACLF